jgi:hypothetical protein
VFGQCVADTQGVGADGDLHREHALAFAVPSGVCKTRAARLILTLST